MKFRKIFFDLDGVLADFNRGVSELLGLEVIPQGSHTEESHNILFGAMRDFHDFYGHLEAIEESVILFHELYEKYGGDVVEILTGVPNPKRNIPEAKENKLDWVRRYLPEDTVVHAVQSRYKNTFCYGKEYILIDDFEVNIREWERAGGTGILFKNADDVRRKLQELENE